MSVIERFEERVCGHARAAAEHIRVFGWQQGSYGERGHPCCIMGAVSATRHDGSKYGTATGVVLARRVCTLIGTDFLVRWHDAAERTKEDVLAVLERVANGEGAL